MVEDFQVIPFGPGTVRATWKPIDVRATDLENYRYVIYYYEVGTIGIEMSISVHSNSSFMVVRNLTIDVEYQFTVAVSRQVGGEKYIGERSSTQTVLVRRGAASGAEFGSMENGGEQF